MISTNKCPKCEAIIGSVNIGEADGKAGFQSRWRCIAYSCPICFSVLGIQMDPIALKADTVDELFQKLRGEI